MVQIKSLSLSGFKTIYDLKDMEFEKINIFIGANGSGKSNIVSFFEMISYMMTDAFGQYVSENGFASSMLYHGQKVTNDITAELKFESRTGLSEYTFRVSHTFNDNLIFMGEEIKYTRKNSQKPFIKNLGDGGYKESKLRELYHKDMTAKYIKNLLASIRVFHFHDTSKTAYIHQARPLESNSTLMSDAGNLAPFLYRMRDENLKYYDRIISYIRQVAPFFDTFLLEAFRNSIQLKFKEKNSSLELGSFRLSDGTIRFIALTALLLQPKNTLPKIIIIDEPELGLHPMAIDILSEMINIASRNSQIFITTQSERLIDHFEPKNIIIMDRKQDANNRYYSDFKKLNNQELSEWTDEYKLSDIWNSNIIGGRP
ncbi:AAA family ATPase [Sulfurovum sp. bin170]|uniref:AAA family ATPase n=1 Tax=Sulfurovum sp. bin170 TaxID=2695268 RepID=UPI0013DEF051|nr:AAA family ATPase [Sulfurovum sp. bin170]NEW61189.1 AAA family ATPase [Sulfurovum sp. bin170]